MLITPARNEAAYIEPTLKSVVAQSIVPKKWVLVSDASTDETDLIVQSYAKRYEFITLVRRTHDQSRNFGSKVAAINEGIEHLILTE